MVNSELKCEIGGWNPGRGRCYSSFAVRTGMVGGKIFSQLAAVSQGVAVRPENSRLPFVIHHSPFAIQD
jgi:hypothetical protein